MNEEVKQALKTCPRCNKKYIGYPAISRTDNKTKICSDCGVEEAQFAMIQHRKKDKE